MIKRKEAPMQTDYDALKAKRAEIAARERAVLASIANLETSGAESDAAADAHAAAVHTEAIALLNGSVAKLLPETPSPLKARQLPALRHELAVLRAADDIGGRLLAELKRAAKAKAAVDRAPERAAIMRRVALALIETEVALVDRDRLDAETSVHRMAPGEHWQPITRLGLRTGPAYEFLLLAVREGWLERRELDKALRAAHR